MNNSLALRSDFDSLVGFALTTVSESSMRIYQTVYGRWGDFCHDNGLNPLDMRPVNVMEFLRTQHVTRKTRKRQLSILRQLARAYAVAEPVIGGQLFTALSMVKQVPSENLSTQERDKRALTPTDVHKILNVWNGDSLLDKRNAALVSLLFLTGLRRSEAAALKWADLDLENAVLFVRHGKGDTERDVTIAGEAAIRALKEWKKCSRNRVYVFSSFKTNQKEPAEDKPTDGQTIYRIIKRTERIAGVSFAPHTARRTFITEGLVQGSSLHNMQVQAGHKRGDTTMIYAKAVDARERRSEFRHRYGD